MSPSSVRNSEIADLRVKIRSVGLALGDDAYTVIGVLDTSFVEGTHRTFPATPGRSAQHESGTQFAVGAPETGRYAGTGEGGAALCMRSLFAGSELVPK